MIKAFEFTLWSPVFHNGEFSHHTERRVIKKANSVQEAKAQLRLRDGGTNKVGESLTVRVDDEFIQSVRYGEIVTYTRFEPIE